MDKTTGVVCDQTITLDGFYSQRDYPEHLRRIRFKDPITGKRLAFSTNATPPADGFATAIRHVCCRTDASCDEPT